MTNVTKKDELGAMNNTLLDPQQLANVNGPLHRDYASHFFRWSFIGRLIKRGIKILDVGAGTGSLAETLYRNKLAPELYVAVEIHKPFITKLLELKQKVNFPIDIFVTDVRNPNWHVEIHPKNYDIVTCFEVVEHFEKQHIQSMLSGMANLVKSSGVVLLSTPNYDGVHHADNHIHEYTEQELIFELVSSFHILAEYGTFMSLGTPSKAKEILSENDYNLFAKLHEYYNSSVLSILFAPAYPQESRNIMYVLSPKKSTNEGIVRVWPPQELIE